MPRPRQDEPPPPSSPPRNRATAAPSAADGSADRCRLADVGTGHGAGPSGAGHSGAPSGRSVARLLASQQSLRRGRARGLQVGCALVLPERQPAERMAVTRVAVAHEAARRTTFCCQSLVPPTSPLRGRHTLRFQQLTVGTTRESAGIRGRASKWYASLCPKSFAPSRLLVAGRARARTHTGGARE